MVTTLGNARFFIVIQKAGHNKVTYSQVKFFELQFKNL